jgi:FkbM family methyltransferase
MSETTLKRRVQNALKRMHVYERLRASLLYEAYWRVADPQVLRQRDREVEFYRHTLRGLRPGDLIFDVGANQGFKSDVFLRLGAKVVAIDPDAANHQKLRERFARLRWRPKPIMLVQKAVSDSNVPQVLWIDAPGSAKNTLSRKWVAILEKDASRFGERLGFESSQEIETITIDDLMVTHGVPFFIKIDVEGHELNVLRGMKRPVRFLSFEVNLPEFREEGRQCIDRLHEIERRGQYNYSEGSEPELAMGDWLCRSEFLTVYDQIECSSAEVFWRVPLEK